MCEFLEGQGCVPGFGAPRVPRVLLLRYQECGRRTEIVLD
jgi:hypothetical protein